ncbi:hypothetical protein CJU90_1182 [Yarrowia sp. C11]|nr:hypothetical protein CKK34_2595 [Yarrowia sp. E02]KAG5373478.1 hypothetical protein CJU90_1182 [Yarrowia sp. C11]
MLVIGHKDLATLLNSLSPYDVEQAKKSLLKSLQEVTKYPETVPHRTVIEADYATHLFMPVVGKEIDESTGSPHIGFKALAGSPEGFKGLTTIMDKSGGVEGIINAFELTAFRTALATSLSWDVYKKTSLYSSHKSPLNLACFGAGPQAYWHIKLALMQFDIDTVFIVNRTAHRADELIERLTHEHPNGKFKRCDTPDTDVPTCALIVGCTPATSPVIHHKWIQKNAYIGLIGSYKPHMCEVDSDIVKSVKKILVDGVEPVFVEAGEIIQNNVPKSELVDVADESEVAKCLGQFDDASLFLWKCVGSSMMDVSVGAQVLKFAKRAGCGKEVDF